MEFDLGRLQELQRHRLMSSVVVPRPIALVTTVNGEGQVNAAPFSWFNIMGIDPVLVAFSPADRRSPGRPPKDTAANVRQTGEFVVNMVSEAIAQQMNTCGIDFPPGVDELAMAGLTPVPSTAVRPPRIAESPVNLECRVAATVEVGRSRVVIGEVLHVHVPDEFVDAETMQINVAAMQIVARMNPPGWAYARTTDQFSMPQLRYDDWLKRQEQRPGKA